MPRIFLDEHFDNFDKKVRLRREEKSIWTKREREREKDERREIATWPPEERCVGLARKWKRNDRTVPSLCLPSAPEPAGKKTRLDARFAVCTIVQGFILIRRTGGTVCSVSCQLQCLSVNGNYILPGLPTRPARCPPFYRSSRNAVFCRAVEYAIPPTFLPEIPPIPSLG